MPNEKGAFIVNLLWRQFALLGRSIQQAISDGKISPIEGIQLAMSGTNLAATLVSLLQKEGEEVRKEVLFVLENGSVTI